ncbi:MAG: hypothetical protein Q8O84_03310 [Nanoarchaeota archaeon]|nr:hypothetical protein [Nanoarchaeota archaeon]
MPKNKLKTPDWILKGGKKPDKKKEGPTGVSSGVKTFKIKECPKCKSDDVGVMITGEECKGGKCDWECRKCKWRGANIIERELTEDEFMKYLDDKKVELPDENELKKDFKKTIESADSEDFGDED